MDSELRSSPTMRPASPTNQPPQIRSRITVVCAECKRLKLKCDRRTPCSSCTKRDTVQRCIYSPAAAEKVDLHSLNNRLIQVEATLAQMTSGQFMSSYPPSAAVPQPSAASSSSSSATTTIPPVVSPNSILSFPLEDVVSAFLEDLELEVSLPCSSIDSRASSWSHPLTRTSTSAVKAEPLSGPISLDFPMDVSERRDDGSSGPSTSSPSFILPSLNIYYSNSPSHGPSSTQRPYLSPSLLSLLPPSASSQKTTITSPFTLQNLLHLAENKVVHTHPSLNWNQFRARAMKMLSVEDNSKEKRAREILFEHGRQAPQTGPETNKDREGIPFFAAVCAALALGTTELRDSNSYSENGRNHEGDFMVVDPVASSSRRAKTRAPPFPSDGALTPIADPAYWYALSVQALSVYEGSSSPTNNDGGSTDYDLDYLVACLLQVVFLVKGGSRSGLTEPTTADKKIKGKASIGVNGGVEGIVFPLVGKIVNIARQIGLTRDPDELTESGIGSTRKSRSRVNHSDTGKPSLFEAEMMRRVWWDVFYYDTFISDAMGHPPLIPEDSFSTRYPNTNVDDRTFKPSSSRIPIPRTEDSSGYMKDGMQYYEVKCRLAQLVRDTKKRMQNPDPLPGQPYRFGQSSTTQNGCNYTIDQAASIETEVQRWLEKLPVCFRLDMSGSSTELDVGTDPVLVAQRCELAIAAYKLIMKGYMPFLQKGDTPAPHQASLGAVNAAHVIIRASRLLQILWNTTRSGREGKLPSLSPATFDLYPLSRTIFDAAVVCGHASIKQPATMWARTAAEQLDIALDVLRDGNIWTGTGGLGLGCDVVEQVDAIRVVECIQTKLQNLGSPKINGHLKRKHDDVEAEPSEVQLTSTSEHRFERTDSPQYQSPTYSPVPPSHQPNFASFLREDECPPPSREKDKKAKKGSYPAVGIRVRTSKEGSSPLARRKSSPVLTEALTSSPQPNLSRPPTSSAEERRRAPFPPETSSTGALSHENYRSRSSSINQPPQIPLQRLQLTQSPVYHSPHTEMYNNGQQENYTNSYEYHNQYRSDAVHPEYSDPVSPFASTTTSSGPLSTASSPYTTGNNISTSTYAAVTVQAAQGFNRPSQEYYAYDSGYDNSNLAMDMSIGQTVEQQHSSASIEYHESMYDVKPAMDSLESGARDMAYPLQQRPEQWPTQDYWYPPS
ncbi:hypothetical protein C8J56DRAFT_431833 [Mycena floridula]|nr:hypothetical protein C8J56DRAFT_431833 [Mycena floridula]